MPYKDKPKAIARKAAKTLDELTSAEVRERLQLGDDELEVLRRISRGERFPGAELALRAMQVRLRHSMPPPTQAVEVARTTVRVVNPYSEPNTNAVIEVATITPAALPAGDDDLDEL